MRIASILIALTLTGEFTCAAARAELPVPSPFTATFLAEFRGIDAGQLTFTFAADKANQQYTYESHANPSALARLIVSPKAIEKSVMTIDDTGVHPVKWRIDDGKSGNKEDGELEFDWTAQRVHGNIKGEAVDLPTAENLQDRISVQIAVITALLRGNDPGTIPMIDDDHIKYYLYKKGNTETLDTKLGKLETVIYESTREQSNRISRFWLAPSLGYAPVRAEQVRKGKIETVLTLIDFKR